MPYQIPKPGQDERSSNGSEDQMKSSVLNNPDPAVDDSQVHYNYSMAHVPYPCNDSYFAGSMTPYGPQAIIQSQMAPQILGLAPARVALPLDLAEDGPIYVNAKQYHGILRRRQSRAKLEAQNRLVKNRKPYLHESRHRHALNRIRGSGGRFLSTKKLQDSDPQLNASTHSGSDTVKTKKKDALEVESHPSRNGENASCITSCSDSTSMSSNSVNFWQQDSRFLGKSPGMGGTLHCSGGLSLGGNQHCASVVR